jgi:DNA-binding response OmpR family regulator
MTTVNNDVQCAKENRHTRILLIDDEQGILDLLSYELGLHGYTVEKAFNGEEGIEKIKQGRFQLVISDVKMPKIGGIAVLEVIKDIDPSTEVIMTTGFGTIDMAVECIKKGAYDFISKPYNLDELCSKVQKALEKQKINSELLSLKELYHLKSEFLSGTSHELRTPAAAILNYASLMLDKVYGSFSEDQEQALKCIRMNAESILRLVNNIASISRLQEGKVALTREEFGVYDLLNEVRRTLAPFAASRHAALSVSADAALLLTSDRSHLKQALILLAANVLKLVPDCALELSGKTNDSGTVRITLTAAGALPPELAGIAGRAGNGTLQGISDARQLADLIEAPLAVDIRGHSTAVFALCIPSKPAAGNGTDPSSADIYPPVPVAGKKPLLVIDDDPAVHKLIREQLKGSSFSFTGALNADDGLSLVRQIKPAAVILDLLLPRKDGWQALEAIRNNADTKDIPVIALSAHDDAAVAQALGAAGYLRKPFGNEALLEQLSIVEHP